MQRLKSCAVETGHPGFMLPLPLLSRSHATDSPYNIATIWCIFGSSAEQSVPPGAVAQALREQHEMAGDELQTLLESRKAQLEASQGECRRLAEEAERAALEAGAQLDASQARVAELAAELAGVTNSLEVLIWIHINTIMQ